MKDEKGRKMRRNERKKGMEEKKGTRKERKESRVIEPRSKVKVGR